jgi:uncharacterized protein (TIGR02145 family)
MQFLNIKSAVITSWVLLCLLAVMLVFGCKKEEEAPVVIETGTVTDIEGTTYRTIKIGNQWWMAENLQVKKYNDGSLIHEAQQPGEWLDSVSAFCLYENNDAAPGLLYNWYAVTDARKIAPQGWHIPSDAEWQTLEVTLGMSSGEAARVSWRGTDEGNKLKVASPQGWTLYSNLWSTNESGFSALAGSCRLFDGTWGNPGLFATGFWWTISEYPGNQGWYRYLDYKNNGVFRSHVAMNYGFSVRCVKD